MERKSPNAFLVFLAGIIDLLICSIWIWIIGYLLFLQVSFLNYTLHVINMAVIVPLYFILFTYGNNGKTIGKTMVGLKVYSLDNKKISFKQSLKRDGVLLIPTFIYLAWHIPVIDEVYLRYEAIITGNFQNIGGFVVDKVSNLLAEILEWSGWVWIFLEFLSILANTEKTSVQDRLSDTRTLR